MIKYFYFSNSDADCAFIRADRLKDMEISADGTDLTLSFTSPLQTKGVAMQLVLSITEDSGRQVMNRIVEEIAFGDEGFIVIADDSDSTYLHSDITDLETALNTSFV